MSIFFVFSLGFGISLSLALGAIRAAPRFGLLDIPGGRRRHIQPVARVGGLALMLTLLLRPVILGPPFEFTPLERTTVLAMAALGLLDDHRELSARLKAALGLGLAVPLARAAAAGLAAAGHPVHFLGMEFPGSFWATFPFLLFMYWGLPQGFNLIDGANGLAMGFALEVLGCLWAAGFPHPYLAGAVLACLALNWPRARLFLGDCGSLSIGLILVILARSALLGQGPDHIVWLFAYPTVDVALVVTIRLFHGRKLGVGDRSHLHFQIQDCWPRLGPWAVPGLLTLAAMCGAETFLAGPWRAIPWTGLALLLLLAAGFGLGSLPVGRLWLAGSGPVLLPGGVEERRQGQEGA